MKRLIGAVVCGVVLSFSAPALAKCYHFSGAPAELGVCVGKNGSDSMSDRKRALQICASVNKKSCGNVSSMAPSCRSASGQCFDEQGRGHKELNGY